VTKQKEEGKEKEGTVRPLAPYAPPKSGEIVVDFVQEPAPGLQVPGEEKEPTRRISKTTPVQPTVTVETPAQVPVPWLQPTTKKDEQPNKETVLVPIVETKKSLVNAQENGEYMRQYMEDMMKQRTEASSVEPEEAEEEEDMVEVGDEKILLDDVEDNHKLKMTPEQLEIYNAKYTERLKAHGMV